MLTYLDGTPLTRRRHLAVKPWRHLAILRAGWPSHSGISITRGSSGSCNGDLSKGGAGRASLLSAMSDIDLRQRIAEAMVGAMRRVQPLDAGAALQAIHQDVTDDNVVSRANRSGRLIPTVSSISATC
ncbi:hypothetical protein F2981_02310 [Sinorhizobium meliloti]|nr:hypothetical protein [Sinorhizobium meliloti]